jgi:hypothetical protein
VRNARFGIVPEFPRVFQFPSLPAWYTEYVIRHRGTTRESRKVQQRSLPSTKEEKLRRHRNKLRIWKRCVRRLLEETGSDLQQAA